MLQTTEGPPLMPVRGGKEEWQQKRIFHVSSGCFSGKKWPKKNCKWWQSNVPVDPPKSLDLSSNQLECFPDARGRHTHKKEGKRKVWWWVAGRESDNSMVNNNQTYLWPCWARLGPCFPFVSVEDGREKKGKKQKSFEFNIFLKYHSKYNLLLLWCTPSWWGQRREGFVKVTVLLPAVPGRPPTCS